MDAYPPTMHIIQTWTAPTALRLLYTSPHTFQLRKQQVESQSAYLNDEQLEVFEVLGRGGSGVVYRGEDRALHCKILSTTPTPCPQLYAKNQIRSCIFLPDSGLWKGLLVAAKVMVVHSEKHDQTRRQVLEASIGSRCERFSDVVEHLSLFPYVSVIPLDIMCFLQEHRRA